MKNAMLVLGFMFFAVEILVGGIYGLSLVPWDRIGGLVTEKVLAATFLIVWNLAGALFLWFGYND